jgi:RNA polymerase-associated protein LEO1
MNVIKVSNIMGIDPKPFDPKTYVEEDVFVTDESGTKKRIRLEDNIVRWRTVRNSNGTTSVSGMLLMYQLGWKLTSVLMMLGLILLCFSLVIFSCF